MIKKIQLLLLVLATYTLPIYALQDHSNGFTVTQIALDAEAVREQIKIEDDSNESMDGEQSPDENSSEGGNAENN